MSRAAIYSALTACALFTIGVLIGYHTFRSFAQARAETVRQDESAARLTLIERTSPGRPIRIRIPIIGVDAQLENVGLKPDGTIGAPKGPVNAAWFYQGPFPGREGSAVIDGHFGWRDGIKAVFDDLSKLKIGDRIYVEDQKGIISAFVVRRVATFGQKDDASTIFNSTDGESHLNLITCGGFWDQESENYSDRTVVFSDKVLEMEL